MYVAVQTTIISDCYIALEIAQGSDRTVTSYSGSLPDRDAMARREPFAEGAARVNNGMTSDERVGPDHRCRVFVVGFPIVGDQRLSNDTMVADCGIIANLDVIIDRGIVPDPDIPADFGPGANIHITITEFHGAAF